MAMPEAVPTDPAAGPHQRVTLRLLTALALLSAVAPLATDLYLPAFPEMVVELHTTATGIQLSLTAFLLGAGLGQVVFGPLSDRIGRLGPLLVGMSVYVAASAAAALAGSLPLLVLARAIQGLSGASGMVIARAIISDLAKGSEAARAFSIMMLVGGVAPVLAPLAGSVLVGAIGWRGLLWVVAGLGLAGLAAVVLFVRETRPTLARADAPRVSGRVLRSLLAPGYAGNALALAFSFAAMMAYISASPFLYQTMMGMDELQYGFAFGANALALAAVGGLSARLVSRFPAARLARIGMGVNLAAVAAATVLALAGAPALWLALPILVAVSSLGLVFGNTTALALESVRQTAGLGSAVLGLLQFALAGVVASLVGIGGEQTAVPMVVTMLAGSVLANAAFAMARNAARASRAGGPTPGGPVAVEETVGVDL